MEAGASLHRHAFATGALFVFRCGEDQITQFAKTRVGGKEIRLAAVEVDAPSAQRDCGRCSPLRPDQAGGPAAGAITDPSPIDDDDPFGARRPGKVRGPSADGAGADDDEVRAGVFDDASPLRLLSDAPTQTSQTLAWH
jgi:hypothetical protein